MTAVTVETPPEITVARGTKSAIYYINPSFQQTASQGGPRLVSFDEPANPTQHAVKPIAVHPVFMPRGTGLQSTYKPKEVTEDCDLLWDFLEYMSPDWDGFGAIAISLDTIENARRLLDLSDPSLPTPDIAPGADGTIGFEWIFEGRPIKKVYIDVGPGDRFRAYRRLSSGAVHQWKESFSLGHSVLYDLFDLSVERDAE
jgi:hypothetical protein